MAGGAVCRRHTHVIFSHERRGVDGSLDLHGYFKINLDIGLGIVYITNMSRIIGIRDLWKRNREVLREVKMGVGVEEIANRTGMSREVVEGVRASKILRPGNEVLAGAGEDAGEAASPSIV